MRNFGSSRELSEVVKVVSKVVSAIVLQHHILIPKKSLHFGTPPWKVWLTKYQLINEAQDKSIVSHCQFEGPKSSLI